MGHFQAFQKKQQEAYIEQTKRDFELSLKPLAHQIIRSIVEGPDSFDRRETAIKALVKRAHTHYKNVVCDAQAEDRERVALEEGDKWVKGLTAIAYDAICAQLGKKI